jgi:hypothetical protein
MATPFNLFDFSSLWGGANMIKTPQSAQNLWKREPILPTVSWKLPEQPQEQIPSVSPEKNQVVSTQEPSNEDLAGLKMLLSKGVDKDRALSIISKSKEISKPKVESPSLLSDIGTSLSERWSKMMDIAQKWTGFEPAIQTGWQIAWAVGDIFWQILVHWIKAITPDAIKTWVENKAKQVLSTEGGQLWLKAIQAWTEAYSSWAKENPNASADLESVINIWSLLPIAKGTQMWAKFALATKEAAIKTWTAIGEKLPSVGKIIKPNTLAIPEGLTKTEQFAAEVLHPKKFTPTALEEAKLAGKFESKKWLGKDWGSYIPWKQDIEIYKTAAPFLNKGATSTENITNVSKAIEKKAIETEAEIGRSGSRFNIDSLNEHLNKIEIPDSIKNDDILLKNYNSLITKIVTRAWKLVDNKWEGKLLDLFKQRKEFDAIAKSVDPNIFNKTNPLSTAFKDLRMWVNDFVATSTKWSNNAKTLLKEQTNLYKALDMLAEQTDQSLLGKLLKPIIIPSIVWGVWYTVWKELFNQ